MATILDVAKLAGVSQGTVSNVLNRKGNVSSEKIRLVEEAAQQLGFTINEKARMLRKGASNVLALILPNIQFQQYQDFYSSFKACAEKNNYQVELMLTADNPNETMEMIQQAKASLKEGIAIVSCLNEEAELQAFQDYRKKLCFIERRPHGKGAYFGFDYCACGRELAWHIKRHVYQNILFFHGTMKHSNAKEIAEAFLLEMNESHSNVVEVSASFLRLPHLLMEAFDSNREIDVIVTTNFGFAEKIRQLMQGVLGKKDIPIYTVSPMFTLPESDYRKYELNYNLLGKQAAEALINEEKKELEKKEVILENDGFRKWHNIVIGRKRADVLNMLALEGPEAVAMRGLAHMYEERTGTKIRISVFSYEEMYEAFVNAESFGIFDIFRIDVTWLSWFSEKILMPLKQLDINIERIFQEYIPALSEPYAYINGEVFALPVTPSAELLFYRKDLFEDAIIRRRYFETYKAELSVPQNFDEFNQIARFFTKSYNDESRVQYGTSLTLGNSGVAATEFLARFFSKQANLYDKNGDIVIYNDAGMEAMNSLLESMKYIDTKVTNWWTDAAKKFADGQVAMEIMFSNYASEILGYRSKIIDRIGVGMVPGGNPIVGGGSLGIAKNSKYPQDALEFIKWFTTDPVATAMAALGGVSPSLKTYDNYEIIDTFPWLVLSKECFSMSKTRRLPVGDLRPFNEKRFNGIVGGMVKNIYAGVVEPEQALALAQKSLNREWNRK